MIEGEYFIYFHRRPDTGAVFYVGRGKRYKKSSPTRRAYETARRSKQWESVVRRNGGKYSVEIVEWFESLDEVLLAEVRHIKTIGRNNAGGTLVNLTAGGDGSLGLRHTPETCAKLREAWRKNPERKEFLRSEKFQSARRETMVKTAGPMTGKKHSPETIAGYSLARSGAKNSQAKTIVDLVTGLEYGCISDAATVVGLSRGTLTQYMSKPHLNTTTMRYK